MPDNVIDLPVITRLDLNPDKILQAAIGEVDSAVVIGWDKEGELYFASSVSGGAEVLWLIENAKIKLLQIGQD